MKKTIFILSLCLAATSLSAQTFQGNVYFKHSNGKTEPLPFAQVYHLEKESLIEADKDGKFSLDLREKATLIATYVGYSRDTQIVMPGMASADFILTGESELEQAVVTGAQAGISKLKSIKTEVISSAGICKMACCALAESFENSASVSVGYSDAVTGARQIKLLGLSGIYTQMLDENRPVMKGLASPFGLQYVPGQWLESIQIAKGPASVTNGLEAITGQINVEHRKPTDENPLFIQVFGSSDRMYEANLSSALQFNDNWSVINLAHIGGTKSVMDSNSDGFRDEPQDMQLNFASRWLYYHPSGLQIRFGGSFLKDDRLGGQTGFRKGSDPATSGFWGSNIVNKGLDGYVKIGVPLNEEQTASIAAIADFSSYQTDSFFGLKRFEGREEGAFFNVIYQNDLTDNHRLVGGATFRHDNLDQKYIYTLPETTDSYAEPRIENSLSAFGEYTFSGEKTTFVGGVNLERNSLHGWLFAPRANLKYDLTDGIIFRALAGRGFRTANIFTDNLGVLSTGRRLSFEDNLDLLEAAWTYGANVTFYLPWGIEEGDSYLSFDYFRSDFDRQVIADQERTKGCFTPPATEDPSQIIDFYNLGGKSFSNTYQLDFNIVPVERFTIALTGRFTDSKVTLKDLGLVERPLTSRFKGVFNVQYATAMNIWTFDFTAQLNGKMRLPAFAARAWGMDESPVYPMLYAQITRKFRGVDVYVGGENLTGFRQEDAILGADNPFGYDFNASCVWGPLTGAKFYAGLRFTLWK